MGSGDIPLCGIIVYVATPMQYSVSCSVYPEMSIWL